MPFWGSWQFLSIDKKIKCGWHPSPQNSFLPYSSSFLSSKKKLTESHEQNYVNTQNLPSLWPPRQEEFGKRTSNFPGQSPPEQNVLIKCSLQKLCQRLHQSSPTNKISLVYPRANKISWTVINFGHIQLLWTAGLLRHLFSLLPSPQTQLKEKWSTFQTQSFSCTKRKGSERFPVHTARIKPRAQPAILSYSVLKDLALRAVLIQPDFFCFEIYAS